MDHIASGYTDSHEAKRLRPDPLWALLTHPDLRVLSHAHTGSPVHRQCHTGNEICLIGGQE
jgi:hypothetical protein